LIGPSDFVTLQACRGDRGTVGTAPTLSRTNSKLNRKKSLADGNTKTGKSIATYSRTPVTTCPGASSWCMDNCYAMRPYRQYKQTRAAWDRNATDRIPKLPKPKKNNELTFFRIHVSGDFDTPEYIMGWYYALKARPDVRAWAYTRSWTTSSGLEYSDLMPYLEKLRSVMQLFASTDPSIQIEPPEGWRIAAIDNDARYSGPKFPICMEQAKKQPDCANCRYCFIGTKGNINFIDHKELQK